MILVTGTDTGVGKTYVTASVVRTLRRKGINACGFKVVETGCSPVCEDAETLSKASGVELKPVYALKQPLAPVVAADIENVTVDPTEIEKRIKELEERFDLLFVEGAGGLLVPITWEYTFLDLAKRLNMKVIVVALNKLGVINHTLLTVRTCQQFNIEVKLVILNNLKEFDKSTRTNLEALRRLLDAPVLPFSTEDDSSSVIEILS